MTHIAMAGGPMTVSIPTRNLGSRRLKVSALGLGCMTMTDVYGPGAEASAVATIDRALELGGCSFSTLLTPMRTEPMSGWWDMPWRAGAIESAWRPSSASSSPTEGAS
jgi:hypothetical protein